MRRFSISDRSRNGSSAWPWSKPNPWFEPVVRAGGSLPISNKVSRPSFGTAGELDAIDLKILSELQANGRITNNDLAGRLGMSPPLCLRRVRALVAGGYITGFRALLNARRLGFDIMAFVAVQLTSQSDACFASVRDGRSRSRTCSGMLARIRRH
jgi:Winged helix-turn-helix DNA-binding